MHFNDWLREITPYLVLVGTVLGIINLWLSFVRHRVKLDVRFSYIGTKEDYYHFGGCFYIRNLGFNPATIDKIGIDGCQKPYSNKRRIFTPEIIPGVTMVKRAEPGDVAKITIGKFAVIKMLNDEPTHVFVTTICGKTFSAKINLDKPMFRDPIFPD